VLNLRQPHGAVRVRPATFEPRPAPLRPLRIKKRRERGKSHRGARGSEHRGSCSQFVAELSATARLSSSKGCAKSMNLAETMTYACFETVRTVTLIVRFGRKAACQVS
jgi:hypothetical protein